MKKKLLLLLLCVSVQTYALFEYDKAIYTAQQGDWNTARAALEQLVAETPDNPQIAYDAGVACYKTDDYQSALRFFEIASKLPNIQSSLKEQAHFNAGNTHLKLKEWDNAIKQYQSALTINKENERTKHNLAYAQQMKQKEEERKASQNDESEKDSHEEEKEEQNKDQNENKQEDKKQQDCKNDKNEKNGDQHQKNNDQKKDEQSQSNKKNDCNQSGQSQNQDKQKAESSQQQKKSSDQNQSGNDSKDSAGNQQQGDSESSQSLKNTEAAQAAQKKSDEKQKVSNQQTASQQKQAAHSKQNVAGQSDKTQQGMGQSEQERKEQWIAQLLSAQEKADQAINKMLIRSAVDKQCGEASHEENSW